MIPCIFIFDSSHLRLKPSETQAALTASFLIGMLTEEKKAVTPVKTGATGMTRGGGTPMSGLVWKKGKTEEELKTIWK